jgi:type I site-specific restriction endonuclease
VEAGYWLQVLDKPTRARRDWQLDDHAEAIVGILREEWGTGNEFAQKTTYRSYQVGGSKPAELIEAFRTSYYPRIVVTDVRPN